MNIKEFNTFIQTIGTSEDETARRDALASLSEGVTPLFEDLSSKAAEVEKLTNDNESLRAANMKLFLKVGNDKDPEDQQKDLTGIKNEPEKKLEFSDLFNEKGEIK